MSRAGRILGVILIALAVLFSVALAVDPSVLNIGSSGTGKAGNEMASDDLIKDPVIAEMIQKIDEGQIYSTVDSLQNFTTRYYGTEGNREASAYLYDELGNISGLTVEFQGGDYRNVVATLPGRDNSSTYVVGAHYDSISDTNNNDAPGATDDGGGVAIVLELARIMSQYDFNHTVVFALWNSEELYSSKGSGSKAYAQYADDSKLNISTYLNFDSSCYDPQNRLVLDIMYNDQSKWVSDIMTKQNDIYGIGFDLTYNAHKCVSDHRAFWEHGYAAVMTHSETHGPSHTSEDTVDKVSTAYAKKNGQLGMSLLATLAGVNAASNDAAKAT